MAFHTRTGRRVEYHCLRCSHTWAPRVLEWPNLCPVCKSRHWHTARTNRQGLRPAKATLRSAKKKTA
jgi:Zn finger protein HypA/HybF involved in hydrogenase expression